MSIIYDALKKVEESNLPALKEKNNKEIPALKSKIRNYLIYALFLILGLFFANIFFSYLNRKPAAAIPQNKLPEPAPLQQAKILSPVVESNEIPPKPTFILNGVFSSGNESYALIDNQIVRIGDKIKGAVLKKITSEEVTLNFAGSEIKLSTRH